MSITILGIESSCDDTSAAVVCDRRKLSNIIASQEVHKTYGGVVPELASRAHQQNIIPVVDTALKKAGTCIHEIDAIAFTRGPGLLGSLLVGASFAKGLALANNIPLIEINHLQAHILSHFIIESGEENKYPSFPFLCLLISGGHTQIMKVNSYLDMEILGKTIDDAAGEAFDKCAKIMGLPYPGGPHIDRLAVRGNPEKYIFSKPQIPAFDFSFSGLKTSFLYTLRDYVKKNPDYIEENKADLSASLQKTIVEILMDKLEKAATETGITEVAVGGGVAANSAVKNALKAKEKDGWNVYIPKFEYTTDNAAMIAVTGYYKFLKKQFTSLDIAPKARYNLF